jgi:cell division protein FtsN
MSKTHSVPPLPTKSAGGTVIGIFIGIILGAAIAATAAWYFTRANPFHTVPGAPRSPTVAQPSALPGKPGGQPVEKSNFDFYTILPEGGTATTRPAPQQQPPQPAPEAAAAVAVEKAWLQLGAFENPAEADNLKAQLALMGIEASLQSGQLADGRTIQRVRVGPFAGPEAMNPVRTRLASAGFTTTVTRAGQ